MAKFERNFQSHLIKRLKLMFEGCIVMKTDPDYIQGIPDLLILFNNKWESFYYQLSHFCLFKLLSNKTNLFNKFKIFIIY